MKKVLVLALAMAVSPWILAKGGGHSSSSSHSGGSHSVSGHTTKNGTYVPPHHATNPDNTKSNNWSQKGNVNPYTGKEGTKQ
jgi:hypothetical protein